MNTEVFKNPEFWLAIMLSFAVSFIIASIFQYCIDELIRLSVNADDGEELYTYSTASLEVGCLVKDEQLNYIGHYAGQSDEGLAIVVIVLDKKCFYYKTKKSNLKVVERLSVMN